MNFALFDSNFDARNLLINKYDMQHVLHVACILLQIFNDPSNAPRRGKGIAIINTHSQRGLTYIHPQATKGHLTN